MEKQPLNNGFTLLESLFVLLITTVLMYGFLQIRSLNSLTIFMEKLMSNCVLTQEKAFVSKQKIQVDIFDDQASFDGDIFTYPNNITCEQFSFHYNAKGNISKANTLTCSDENHTKKLVFQLGSGRVRVEE